MSDGYIGFLCGLATGFILGVMALAIFIVMRDEERKNNGNQKSNRDIDM